MGSDGDTKNLILAAVLSMLVVVAWYAIFPPTPPQEDPVQQAIESSEGAVPVPGQEGAQAANAPAVAQTREAALCADPDGAVLLLRQGVDGPVIDPV